MDGGKASEGATARLQDAMNRAYQASLAKSHRSANDRRTAYIIDIPAQMLSLYSRELAEVTIKTLKNVGVKGTYRATKGGGNEGNRA